MNREQIKQTLIDHGVSHISGALLDALAPPEANELAPDHPPTVSKEARERAWPFRGPAYRQDGCTHRGWMDGVYDHHPAIQAFARFEAHLRTPASGEAGEMVEQLRLGVHEIGLHEDNNTELFDIEDANERMAEAADLITRLSNDTEAMRQALHDTVNRFEYAANMFHNVKQWHGEEAPDGSNLAEWVWQPSKDALAKGGAS